MCFVNCKRNLSSHTNVRSSNVTLTTLDINSVQCTGDSVTGTGKTFQGSSKTNCYPFGKYSFEGFCTGGG